jgi:tagatose 6-phosphate kinase
MILCVGTTPALQRVLMFRVLRLNAVNRAVTTLEGPSGKSVNVAKVLKALGEAPVAVGFRGGERGEKLHRQLRALQIELDFVTVAAETRQCVTVMDESAGTVTELVEEGRPVTSADYAQLDASIRRHMRGCRAVVFSGTLAPGGPADFHSRYVRLANETEAITVVDAQGLALNDALKAQPVLVKPNRLELATTVGRELPDEDAVFAAMRELHARGTRWVVVTAGKDPVLAFDGRDGWRIRPPQIVAVNPIGSGDAFAAGLVWRLVRGDDLGEACRWGAAAGAANALTPLAGELKRADVERLAAAVQIERLPKV